MIEAWHFWAITGVVFWIIELFTPGLFVMGVFGTACLVAVPFAVVVMSLKIQLMAFGIAAGIMALGIRPLIMKHCYGREVRVRTNIDALIDRSCSVIEEIDSIAGTGRVKIGGEIWRAIASDASLIAVGRKVRVRELEGCKVIVEAVSDDGGGGA
jgi:membrane protein implicated in regulation of membrane protease activity